jgi:hypothetical protein
MGTEYPEHLLAREPAPPYDGEGAFALWHFSEDPSLGRFHPHTPATNLEAPPLVWAVDTRHLAGRHASAGIELRITPSIWPFWRQVTNSTVEFSGSRLRNTAPHPDRGA